ncbi:MAG: pilus assembly protein TadG-related protein [Hyphomicrobium sp.]
MFKHVRKQADAFRSKLASRHQGLDELSQFKRAEHGNVAMLFGLMLMTMCLLIGGSVDMGRWLNARDQTFSAIDAAILAAGRAIQTGSTESEALALAKRIYDSNTKTRIRVMEDSVHFMVKDNGATIATIGKVAIKTPFLGFINIENLPLFSSDEAPEATTAQDRYERYNREVALMLDVSGSMCSPCSKRDDMKAAAKDLVEILMKSNANSEFKARVAVIPFSGDVRPPQSMLSLITDLTAPPYVTVSSNSKSKKPKYYTYYKSQCVSERVGSQRYTNASPSLGYVLSAYNDPDYYPVSRQYCEIDPADTVLPLTLDKSAVLGRIDGLQTKGGTAGHVGTAWAYYMLSPSWGDVIPSISLPSDFGTKSLKKIAIMMTDGEYNLERDSKGITVGDNGSGSSANGKTSAQQAVEICNQMKNDGIEIYTVGFDLGGNNTAINTLNSCASDGSHSYLADTGEQLKQAFRDIAVKLTDLYVSK